MCDETCTCTSLKFRNSLLSDAIDAQEKRIKQLEADLKWWNQSTQGSSTSMDHDDTQAKRIKQLEVALKWWNQTNEDELLVSRERYNYLLHQEAIADGLREENATLRKRLDLLGGSL